MRPNEPDPGADRAVKMNKKKSTARWCRGKAGVEHVTEIVVNHNFLNYAGCKWFAVWRRVEGEFRAVNFKWHCRHSERCVNCGKYVTYFLPEQQCPDWKPLETTNA